MRNKHPTAPYDSGGACKSFLDSLGSTSSHTEQDFYDVHINADGSVVSVYFLPDVGAHQLARDAARSVWPSSTTIRWPAAVY
jgi:hypothetical protein